MRELVAHPGRTDRAADLLTLTRLSTRDDALEAILDWLASRVGATVALLAEDGRKLVAAPGAERALLVEAARAVPDLHRRGTASAVVASERPPGGAIHLVRLGGTSSAGTDGGVSSSPYLVAVDGAESRRGDLLADAARVLALCWRVAEAGRHRQRVETAETHAREAVLHLLMVGAVSPAQRVAAVLRPRLPESARLYVFEGPISVRAAVAAQVRAATRARAWMVPCPVRPNHLIVLAPVDGGTVAESPELLARSVIDRVPECRAGVSDEVALREAATGYEQAFHALAAARVAPGGYASVSRRADLAPFLGLDGYRWARGLLRPCASYVPARRADPGGGELLDTLRSWLTLDTGASRQLKIHRNTLASRLRLIGELLGVDLTAIRAQSAAWLALRLHGEPGAQDPPEPFTPATEGDGASLDDLLAAPAARSWARSRLRPLEQGRPAGGLTTVGAWLRADTRLSATAEALGLSLPGTRKRLVRVEQTLGCSLLRAPGSKHELWLAMRALDLL